MSSFLFFFFQAEDGIRDKLVTGVQTCALPISGQGGIERAGARRGEAAAARAAGALPGGTHGSDVSFGGLSGLWRTVREPRSDARHRGRARSGRRRVRRGRVLRSRAAAGDLAGANDRLRGVTGRRRENPSRKGVQRSMIGGVPREIKT